MAPAAPDRHDEDIPDRSPQVRLAVGGGFARTRQTIPRHSRRLTLIAASITLLLHVLLLLWLRVSLHPTTVPPLDDERIEVELIAAPPVAPLAPAVEPLPRSSPTPASPASTARAAVPGKNPVLARSSSVPVPDPIAANAPVAAAPTLRFYNPDSSLNIPKDLLAQMQRAQAAKPDFIARELVPPEFMQHKNPLHYLATDFEPSWVPLNEDLLAEFVRRNLTREVTFKTPWGGTIRCTWVFVMGACAGVPPPAWKNPDKKALPPPAPEWQ